MANRESSKEKCELCGEPFVGSDWVDPDGHGIGKCSDPSFRLPASTEGAAPTCIVCGRTRAWDGHDKILQAFEHKFITSAAPDSPELPPLMRLQIGDTVDQSAMSAILAVVTQRDGALAIIKRLEGEHAQIIELKDRGFEILRKDHHHWKERAEKAELERLSPKASEGGK